MRYKRVFYVGIGALLATSLNARSTLWISFTPEHLKAELARIELKIQVLSEKKELQLLELHRFVRKVKNIKASATTHNEVIKKYYERLQSKGKPHKLIMIASMRKLLCILNAMMRNDTDWQENYAQPRG